MYRLICLAVGYALGLVQSAFIVGKIFGKIDIRDHGSGNAGMTNVARVMGGKMAAVVLCADMLKAILAYIICSLIFNGSGSFFAFGGGVNGVLPGIYGAFGAVLGHVFPVYLKFKGGKGIACGLGFVLFFDWKIALICYAMALIVIPLTRYISLASIIGLVFLPVFAFVFGYGMEVLILCLALSAILLYKHRTNIMRLAKGSENKFTLKKRENKGKL